MAKLISTLIKISRPGGEEKVCWRDFVQVIQEWGSDEPEVGLPRQEGGLGYISMRGGSNVRESHTAGEFSEAWKVSWLSYFSRIVLIIVLRTWAGRIGGW